MTIDSNPTNPEINVIAEKPGTGFGKPPTEINIVPPGIDLDSCAKDILCAMLSNPNVDPGNLTSAELDRINEHAISTAAVLIIQLHNADSTRKWIEHGTAE